MKKELVKKNKDLIAIEEGIILYIYKSTKFRNGIQSYICIILLNKTSY